MRWAFAALILAAASLPVSTRAGSAQQCEAVTDAQTQAAIASAVNFVSKTWVERGPDWISGYDSKPVARNPFAVSKQDSGSAAIHGYVWARDVSCRVIGGLDGGLLSVTFTAGAVRFKEEKTRWSKPQNDSVLVALDLLLSDGNWAVTDKSAERSVLSPENTLRHPETSELPKPNLWPDKRCLFPKHWEGKLCVPEQAGSGSH